MFYTLTLNPALDYVVETDGLRLGETNRSNESEIQLGGKGLNVSYVLGQLGVSSVALGFVAGFTGNELERLAAASGIKTDFVHLSQGMTRINVKLKGDTETEINTSGPVVSDVELCELFSKLDVLKSGDTLVMAGSIPPSLPNNIYEKIMQRLYNRGVRFAVDASKDVLLNTLKYKPLLIKPNLAELCETVGKDLNSEAEILTAARFLQAKGALNVLVSMGEKGAILVDSRGLEHRAPARQLTPVNTVGAGDSMVAGFLKGLRLGPEYALRLAMAAASATAASKDLATKAEIEQFLR